MRTSHFQAQVSGTGCSIVLVSAGRGAGSMHALSLCATPCFVPSQHHGKSQAASSICLLAVCLKAREPAVSAYSSRNSHLLTAEEPEVDFLQWLSTTVGQAARSAEEHELLCATSDALTASLESHFKLSHVVVSCNTTCLEGDSRRTHHQ